MATSSALPPNPKLKLSKDQKHYLEILEHVDADIEKKTAARDKAAGRIMRLQKELDAMEQTIGNLKHMKKATEDLLSSTPPPPQWEKVFKTVYEHHYHYHYPQQPVIWPTWPYWNPQQPYYSGPYWWNTVSCQGNISLDAVKTIVTNTAGSAGLPGSSVIVPNGGNLSLNDAKSGSFSFTNSNMPETPSLASSCFSVNSSLPTSSGINMTELSTPNMKLTS
jgi:hypothetical protein